MDRDKLDVIFGNSDFSSQTNKMFHIYENRNCILNLKDQVIRLFYYNEMDKSDMCDLDCKKLQPILFVAGKLLRFFHQLNYFFLHIFFVKNDFTNFIGTFFGRF